MPAEKQSVAFFGATGGCAIACLAHALQRGYDCHALVRSEAKLQNLLTERKVSPEAISANLTVVQGDIKDQSAVTQTVCPTGGRTVDTVVSGIGGRPTFKPNPLKPTLPDPTICQDAIKTILNSLRRCPGPKPLLVTVSTTGISKHGRDIPVAMVPLYHWLLAVPHADKKAMESILATEMAQNPSDRAISSYLIVRPSLLTDGQQTNMSHIKVGGDKNPKIGYTISRDDVGMWMFETGIVNQDAGRQGRIASITY